MADFVTIHVTKTPETIGLIGAELLAKAKPGLRHHQRRAGRHRRRAGAGRRDRRRAASAAPPSTCSTKEPTTESPLFELDSVVVTPHLGASTHEAQDKAGDTIAEQVELALAGEFVPFAVNVSAAEASETVRPFLPLAERLGELLRLARPGRRPTSLEVEYQGQIAGYDTRILTLSVLKGYFGRISDEPVSFVNAPQLAAERGIEVRETATTTAHDYVNLITVRGGDHALAGTLVGPAGRAPHRDGRRPHRRRAARRRTCWSSATTTGPGMIGVVGTALGEAGINIADMPRRPVGRRAWPRSWCWPPRRRCRPRWCRRLEATPGIVSVHAVDLR